MKRRTLLILFALLVGPRATIAPAAQQTGSLRLYIARHGETDWNVQHKLQGMTDIPLNENGLAYSRTAGQVLNIVYLNKNAVTLGGFFPAGVNGTIRTSAAS